MRIVSLAPSVTETLFALGAGAEVVGVSQYCDYPPQVLALPRVGSFLTPNLEAIIALRPTLVVGLELSSDVRQIRALNSMGYPVLLVSDDSLQEIEDSIEKVGARISRPDDADRLVAEIEAQIAAIQQRLASVKPVRALMLVGHQPIVAVGTGTYLDELMRIARADNIAAAAGEQWPHLSMEFIIAMRPEVILDGAMGSDSASSDDFWEKYPTIPAVRDHRVYGYAEDPMLHAGPRVGQSLEDNRAQDSSRGMAARGRQVNAPASKPAPAAHLTRARLLSILGVLVILLIVCAVAGLLFGTAHISLARAFSDPDSPDHAIFFAARLPRVLMGVIVGAMLAAVGTALQALVRNPLAEGGILGISGGGAFGAILALVLSAKIGGGEATVPLCAFGAALLSTVAVYRLAMVDGQLEPFTLLLVGVIFNSFWGAAIMLVNSVVNFYFAHSILFWLMGSLEAPTYGEAAMVAVLGLAGFAVLMYHARDLNLLSLGDESAAELGVDVDSLRRTIFVATSVMIGAAVSVSGIISFVGLIVPHTLRLMFGADHRLLLPASLIGGAAFMVAADLLARVAIAPSEIPVGAITALCGGPFFIYMLRREGRRPLSL